MYVQSRQDESIEPALAPKTFDSNRLDNGLDGIPLEYAGSVWSRGWYEARQWVVDKYYDKNFKFMLILLLLVIAFGTANRVIYKIQLYSRPPLLVVFGVRAVCVRACVLRLIIRFTVRFRGTPSSPQMNNYTIFISWVLTTAYCFLYFGIFSVRRYGLFIIDDDQVGYVFSWRGLKLIVMGLMVR